MSLDFTADPCLMALQATLANNRFMPVPPSDLMQCGDGDYRGVGAEFLGHFIRFADLLPDDRVLDLGCGVGRMAVPLTQYLSQSGGYVGMDVSLAGIDWCRRSITPAYPNFRFEHIDVQHPLYNPAGTAQAETIRLPFADHSFDVICLVSVLTHLGTVAMTHYASEVGRLLAPGGRCFATAFLANQPARDAQQRGGCPLQFDLSRPGVEFYANPDAPLAAVAFDEDHLLEKFLRYGLKRQRMPVYGHWSGRPSSVFQDINVFERSEV